MSSEPVAGFPAPQGEPPRYQEPAPPRESSIPPEPMEPRPGLNLLLFCLTLVSMLVTATLNQPVELSMREALRMGAYQAFSLLGILVVHELGHYVASRIHGVPASPPFFLPLPVISLFGTMGAVITMQDRIRSRKALLDIGAAGPLAGLVVAIPVLCIGLSLSTVQAPSSASYTQEGQSILYWLLKRIIVGPIPTGQDVYLHPMAFAGWGGLFLTMINLLPWGQLDGGHIAYALFGERQNRYAVWVRRSLLLAFLYNVYVLVVPVLLHHSRQSLKDAAGSSLFWLFWFGITGLMARYAGAEHPPFEPSELGTGRKVVAVSCLVLFVLLFLPMPLVVYQ